MNHLPGAVEIAEQEGLVTGLVEFKPGRAHLALDLGIGDRPGEIPFEIDHDIVKVEAEVLERILFRLDMMGHQIIEGDSSEQLEEFLAGKKYQAFARPLGFSYMGLLKRVM